MTPKNICLFGILCFYVAFGPQLVGAAENHCKDQESWKEWDALIQKYPDDLDIQALHALRLGLCAKIERGEITIEDNPNGSQESIAGVCNLNRNCLGLMPHPERASEAILSPKGTEHGRLFFESMVGFIKKGVS